MVTRRWLVVSVLFLTGASSIAAQVSETAEARRFPAAGSPHPRRQLLSVPRPRLAHAPGEAPSRHCRTVLSPSVPAARRSSRATRRVASSTSASRTRTRRGGCRRRSCPTRRFRRSRSRCCAGGSRRGRPGTSTGRSSRSRASILPQWPTKRGFGTRSTASCSRGSRRRVSRRRPKPIGARSPGEWRSISRDFLLSPRRSRGFLSDTSDEAYETTRRRAPRSRSTGGSIAPATGSMPRATEIPTASTSTTIARCTSTAIG